jgi:hypothetical protein
VAQPEFDRICIRRRRQLVPLERIAFVDIEDQDRGWPRVFDTDEYNIIVHQPQVDEWPDFERWKQDELDLGLSETGFLVLLHFKSPDWAGHRNGAASSQYRRAIV